MGMEDVGPCFFDDLIEAGAGTLHLGQLTQHRQPLRRGGGLRRAVEGPSSCFVDEAIEAILLGRRHLHRVPTALALRREDAHRAKAVDRKSTRLNSSN